MTLATKSEDLSSIPGTYMVEGGNQLLQSVPLIQMHVQATPTPPMNNKM